MQATTTGGSATAVGAITGRVTRSDPAKRSCASATAARNGIPMVHSSISDASLGCRLIDLSPCNIRLRSRQGTPANMRLPVRPGRVAALATVNDIFLSSLKWHVGHAHGSASLIADAKHSLTDVAMDVGALMTVEHSEAVQGYFKIAVCLSLCAMSASFLKEALYWTPVHSRAAKTIPAVVFVQSIVVFSKETTFRLMRRVSRVANSPALFAAAQHQRADVGVSIGAGVATCMMAVGFRWADRICTAAIAVVMLDTALRLYRTV